MADRLTRAHVFTAADQISTAGQQPTVAGIRAKLGTGSYTTITAMLREWKEQAEAPADDALDVPEEITQALGRAAEIVWKAAQDHFRHELATVKKEADRTCQQATSQATEALQEIARLEQQLDDCTRDNVATVEHLRKAQQETIAAATKIATLSAELRAAQERVTEQAVLLQRLTAPNVASTRETPPATPQKKAKTPTASHLIVMYRHPTMDNMTWNGRGKRPQWVDQWIAAGNALEALSTPAPRPDGDQADTETLPLI
jgi:DNA-binding protein H-NS